MGARFPALPQQLTTRLRRSFGAAGSEVALE